MPCDYTKYPPNWKTEIRPRILARAGEIRDAEGFVTQEASCERCEVLNHAYITRTETGWDFALPEEEGTVYIILTVAHLDHDLKHNEDTNLAALCQKCHLGHDARQHVETARRNREARSGQGIFEGLA